MSSFNNIKKNCAQCSLHAFVKLFIKGRVRFKYRSTHAHWLHSRISFLRPLLDWARCNCPPAWRVWTIKSMGAGPSPPPRRRAIKPCKSSLQPPSPPAAFHHYDRRVQVDRPNVVTEEQQLLDAGWEPRSRTFPDIFCLRPSHHSASVFTALSV